MIKLGPLVQQTVDGKFPNNWKSLAVMLNVPYEMYNDGEDDLPEDMSIEIEFSDTITLNINANNSISTTAPIENEMIAQIVVNLANIAREEKKANVS